MTPEQLNELERRKMAASEPDAFEAEYENEALPSLSRNPLAEDGAEDERTEQSAAATVPPPPGWITTGYHLDTDGKVRPMGYDERVIEEGEAKAKEGHDAK